MTGGPAVEGIDVGLVRDVCRFDSRRTADPCAGGETEVLPGELFPKAGRRRRFVALLPLGAPLCAHSPCVCVTRTGGALPPRAVTSLCRRSCREASATNPLDHEAFASKKKKIAARFFATALCELRIVQSREAPKPGTNARRKDYRIPGRVRGDPCAQAPEVMLCPVVRVWRDFLSDARAAPVTRSRDTRLTQYNSCGGAGAG